MAERRVFSYEMWRGEIKLVGPPGDDNTLSKVLSCGKAF
jgi:hypothetical protein